MTTKLNKPIIGKSKLEAALSFAEEVAQEKTPKEKTARLNANIPVELHRALKVRAATEGKSIGDLVEAWIRSWAKP